MWFLYGPSILEPNVGRLGSPSFLTERQWPGLFAETAGMSGALDQEPGREAFDSESSPTLANGTRENLYRHRCPTCMQEHVVNEVRHRLAYGRQLTCSCKCEIQRRKAIKMKWRSTRHRLPDPDK
jgi:hypothetical protein